MKNSLFVLGAALALVSCGVSEAQTGNEFNVDDGEAGGELSLRTRSYVTLRRDLRRCAAPLCGGYYVQDVNRATPNEQYVSALDFTAATLDLASQHDVTTAADGEVIVYGKLGATDSPATQKFVVTTAWRGMPGVKVAAGANFYRLDAANVQCITAPCPTVKAIKLNATTGTLAHDVDVTHAALARVDQTWLTGRAVNKRAMVAASLRAEGRETVVDASQVFVALPDQVNSCAKPVLPHCTAGKVLAWQRTADRCLMPLGCVTAGACTASVPTCSKGYTLNSWQGGLNACQQFACDPDFLFDE
jgi:hypothetical protein